MEKITRAIRSSSVDLSAGSVKTDTGRILLRTNPSDTRRIPEVLNRYASGGESIFQIAASGRARPYRPGVHSPRVPAPPLLAHGALSLWLRDADRWDEIPDKMTMGASVQWYSSATGKAENFPDCP